MNLQRYTRLLPVALATSLVLVIVLGGNAAAHWLEALPVFSNFQQEGTISNPDRVDTTTVLDNEQHNTTSPYPGTNDQGNNGNNVSSDPNNTSPTVTNTSPDDRSDDRTNEPTNMPTATPEDGYNRNDQVPTSAPTATPDHNDDNDDHNDDND